LAYFNIVKKKEKKEKLIIKSELETYRMEYSTLSLLSSLRQNVAYVIYDREDR